MRDPTRRFADRVADYIRYRPSYPSEILDFLETECGLTPEWIVADIGSGTGILSRLFLDHGNQVFAVEPNQEMREAAEQSFADNPRFTSVAETAEATSLPDGSVQLITAGQAFHWFDREPTRAEFARILGPGGWVVIVWNTRRRASTPFLTAYEKLLLTWASDYRDVDFTRIGRDEYAAFFSPGAMRTATFPNQQIFDYDGLQGRLLSSSYTPVPGHPDHDPMLADLRTVFDTHQTDGHVAIDYDTQLYYGQLT